MNFQKRLCKLGFHNWSPNHYGVRVCLARGCVAIDLYYGICGMLRYLREHYREEEIDEMAVGGMLKCMKLSLRRDKRA